MAISFILTAGRIIWKDVQKEGREG